MLLSPSRLLAGAVPAGLPVARDLVHAGLARVFGSPPFDADAYPGDLGLFGPRSASWRIIAEPSAIVGGIRALLVQLLHPLAVAGVADHSRYADDPLGRLHGTSAWVTTTTFGSVPEAITVARGVRRLHARVAGTAPDGRAYRADDPRLLAWVATALTSSFLAADRCYAPQPADPATVDAFVAEQARGAALLDPRVDLDAVADPGAHAALRAGTYPLPLLAEGALPQTAAQLAAFMDGFRPELAVNAQGRDVLHFMLWPNLAPPLRAAYLPLLAGALATMDPGDRRLLGMPSARAAAAPVQVQTRALLSVLRLSTGVSPSLAAATRRVRRRPA